MYVTKKIWQHDLCISMDSDSLCRSHSLEASLREMEKLLNEEKMRFQKLKEDFKYNLKLLGERDAELDKYDSMFTGKNKFLYLMLSCILNSTTLKGPKYCISVNTNNTNNLYDTVQPLQGLCILYVLIFK